MESAPPHPQPNNGEIIMSKSIPERKDVKKEDQWNLAKLFKSEEQWEKALLDFEKMIPKISTFKGTLSKSAASLKSCMDYMNEVDKLDEKLGVYAFLRQAEDQGNSESTGRMSRYMRISTQAGAASSFFNPELLSINDELIGAYLADDILKDYRITLKKMLRFKPHVLSEKEETLLAKQQEFTSTPSKAFDALTNVDIEYGEIGTKDGKKPLTNATFNLLLQSDEPEVRKQTYNQFYGQLDKHKNTIAQLYNGSVQMDIFKSSIRKYSSARKMSLFGDDVDESVYDNLINAVTQSLPALHEYYELRKKVLGLEEQHIYDTKTPLVKDVKAVHTFEEAVDKIYCALAPMGDEYRETLKEGLLGTWVDRYENKGKRSGAFSYGTYSGEPYILMNYNDENIRDLFTLAHEGGHSMHSWYSVRNNPFQHYNYTIFEAEVASTFNEQLLGDYLLKHTDSKEMKAYLIGNQIDDILSTVYRQTMFAEYEHICHKMVEEGQPLTVDSLREEYRKLLEKYFGPSVILEETSDLEGLRIPHFYRAFYVYKYATGLSAAITLARKILKGGEKEREDYTNFLKSGGSRFPLESLKLAGVDMSSPEPVKLALDHFADLVKELKDILL
ncbi:MAG: oligoendopeptidase F [Spirochaetaceae bacterium]|nr:oligoendopeptidase F [Spirochaetaceae bacterium]